MDMKSSGGRCISLLLKRCLSIEKGSMALCDAVTVASYGINLLAARLLCEEMLLLPRMRCLCQGAWRPHQLCHSLDVLIANYRWAGLLLLCNFAWRAATSLKLTSNTFNQLRVRLKSILYMRLHRLLHFGVGASTLPLVLLDQEGCEQMVPALRNRMVEAWCVTSWTALHLSLLLGLGINQAVCLALESWINQLILSLLG